MSLNQKLSLANIILKLLNVDGVYYLEEVWYDFANNRIDKYEKEVGQIEIVQKEQILEKWHITAYFKNHGIFAKMIGTKDSIGRYEFENFIYEVKPHKKEIVVYE